MHFSPRTAQMFNPKRSLLDGSMTRQASVGSKLNLTYIQHFLTKTKHSHKEN